MKKREVTLIAFADFSKAFDTVDYLTVLRKLHAVIVFSTSSLTWVLNYLTSRKQFVQVNDKQSDPLNVHFGMPQESILRPVIFNLCVNDLQSQTDYMTAGVSNMLMIQLFMITAPLTISALVYIYKMNNTMSALQDWATESNLLIIKQWREHKTFANNDLADISYCKRSNFGTSPNVQSPVYLV
jgi:hypothetical protein